MELFFIKILKGGVVKMLTATDLAKAIIKQDPNSFNNSFDGNMKLQKLLFFAYMVHLTNNEEPLFREKIRAFAKGCVVDGVRERYQYNYQDFIDESYKFKPDFTQSQLETMDTTIKLFGHLSAKVLSELTHQFDFWNRRFHDSINSDCTYDQDKNVITIDDMLQETDKIEKLLNARTSVSMKEDTINGIKFLFDDNIEITDSLYDFLFDFSNSEEAEEEVYNVYMDNNELVVY